MSDKPRFWSSDPDWRDYEAPYDKGGYIGPGPGLALIHSGDHFISADQLARLGLDYMKRTYGKTNGEEEDIT